MNKKALVLAFMLLAIPILTAVPAYAGKGQTKLDFVLHVEGLPSGVYEQMWTSGNTENPTDHYRGMIFALLGDCYVQIGTDVIPSEYLEYEATMDYDWHTAPAKGWFNARVTEVISIYSSDETHDEGTLMGTLELRALGIGKSEIDTCVGFGTGEFEGVKIKGTSVTAPLFGANPNPPPPYILSITRTGTVMGWPTP